MKLVRSIKICLRHMLYKGLFLRQPWKLQQHVHVPRKRSWVAERCCGTKTLLVIMFTLTLLSNIYLRIIGFSDYFVITYTHDDFNGPCALPILNPFDPAMLRDYKKLQPFKCTMSEPFVYFDSDNILQFNSSVLQRRHLSADDVTCRCKDVIRVDDDAWVKFSEPYTCVLPLEYKDDFLNVECYHKSKKVYSNFLSNIHRKKRYGDVKGDNYNVLLFGIDTVSRSSSIRNLKKTVQFLRKIDAFDFKGHMKNGENTYPNLIAMLTGLKTTGKDEFPIKDETFEFFDDKPFIWKEFSRKNYTTLYAEDLPLLNTFNLRKKGFKQKPVDHYMRPYWLGWHEISPMRDYKNGISLELLNVGAFKPSLEKYLCAGNVPNYVAHMQYVKRFFDTYKHERKFAMSFMVEIAHNNQNILNLADDEIYKFFTGLQENGHLENTIVIMFSDHGPKMGDTFYTARVEKSMPMLYMVLPKKLKQSHPSLVKHLSQNTKKLTTHFDMFATLSDIVRARYEEPTVFKKNGVVRGYSLFGSMPQGRSCAGKLTLSEAFYSHQQVLY